MDAIDIMTRPVITAPPDTPVLKVAQLMSDHRISGIPVVDAQEGLVGLVTEGDLLRRTELHTERRAKGLIAAIFLGRREAEAFISAHGTTAKDVMSANVVAVAPDTTVRQIANIFETRGIRRVPVVDNGALVGIVSRADLIRALATGAGAQRHPSLSDRQIGDLVMVKFESLPFGPRSRARITVHNGEVALWGLVGSIEERRALQIAAAEIPGVKSVVDQTYELAPPFGVASQLTHTVTLIGREKA